VVISVVRTAASNDRMITPTNNEYTRIWKAAAVLKFKVCLLTWCLPEATEQNHESIKDSGCTSRDLNPGSLKYKTELLTIRQLHLVDLD
jgi:hypothetical protein